MGPDSKLGALGHISVWGQPCHFNILSFLTLPPMYPELGKGATEDSLYSPGLHRAPILDHSIHTYLQGTDYTPSTVLDTEGLALAKQDPLFEFTL